MFLGERIKQKILFFVLIILCYSANSQSVVVKGELRKWHKVVVELTGPQATEDAATFTNNRMDVTFTHVESGKKITVPGFFAADGDAANSSAVSGNKWQAVLCPDALGLWTYEIKFYQGVNVAYSTILPAVNAQYSVTGSVGEIKAAIGLSENDLRFRGRLVKYGNFRKWSETGKLYLKIGPDSPENLLDYADFDFASVRKSGADKYTQHTFTPHLNNWKQGDPTWKNGLGKGLIGALNYLAQNDRVNSLSTSVFGGDDENVFPWTVRASKFIYDVSKLSQWEVVFDHAETQGLLFHFKLSENENHREDGMVAGSAYLAVYYREMIARFGHHLALEWNIGEEFGSVNGTAYGSEAATASEAIKRGKILHQLDAYHNSVVLHTGPTPLQKIYDAIIAEDVTAIDGISMQNSESNSWAVIYTYSKKYSENSRAAGNPWIVATDEQNSGGSGVFSTSDMNSPLISNGKPARTNVLWGCFMGGGNGVMFYGGSKGDFLTENFNRYSQLHKWSDYCVNQFFLGNNIPVDEMTVSSATSLGWCLAKSGVVYVVFLKDGGTSTITLPSGNYKVKWFNPRSGGTLIDGSITSLVGGSPASIGTAPTDTNEDWAILVYETSKFDPMGKVDGVNLLDKNSDIFLSPNPVSTFLTITSVNKIESEITVYSIYGQKLNLDVIHKNSNHILINCTKIPRGIYVVQIGSKTIKFFKQ